MQSIGAIMATVAMPSRQKDAENAEYNHRMVVNAIAASFVTFLVAGGYWIVSTLVKVS
jgi:hypothetical protein